MSIYDLIDLLIKNCRFPSIEAIDDAVLADVSDIKSVYYSCLLYEQIKRKIDIIDSQQFWIKEIEKGNCFVGLMNTARGLDNFLRGGIQQK